MDHSVKDFLTLPFALPLQDTFRQSKEEFLTFVFVQFVFSLVVSI